jgi:hypothetical protein
MAGGPPQPADQRKGGDRMDAEFAKLEGAWSAELLALVRSCLAMDPLARPQSVFALQKVLQAAAPAAVAQQPAAAQPVGGWRGLLGRLGGLKRGGPS